MREILVNSKKCTGCRVCEIACSYHFRKLFNRKISAIEVKRYESKGKTFRIVVHKEPVDRRFACDLCAHEIVPLCVKYCVVSAVDLKT